MCSLCLTTHTNGGVALMTARRTGAADRRGGPPGRLGRAVRAHRPASPRGRRQAAGGGVVDESLTRAEKVARVRADLRSFLDRVTA